MKSRALVPVNCLKKFPLVCAYFGCIDTLDELRVLVYQPCFTEDIGSGVFQLKRFGSSLRTSLRITHLPVWSTECPSWNCAHVSRRVSVPVSAPVRQPSSLYRRRPAKQDGSVKILIHFRFLFLGDSRKSNDWFSEGLRWPGEVWPEWRGKSINKHYRKTSTFQARRYS